MLRMRPRSVLEAADLGIRLAQANAKSVYQCYAFVVLPIVAVALAAQEIATWLPTTLLWCAKPWLDRTIVFVLSRAAFGNSTSPSDVWHARRTVWWQQLLLTWTLRRLSPWRSFTQPAYQLEGVSLFKLASRLKLLRRQTAGPATLVTSTFSLAELALTLAVGSLLFWFAPPGKGQEVWTTLFEGDGGAVWLFFSAAYSIVLLFLEPFYVAAGFGVYLNRRAELEAWDVEQELRGAFAA